MLVRTERASQREQMGRVADVFGAARQPTKRQEKQRKKRKEEKAHHGMTIGLISAESDLAAPWDKGSRQTAHVLLHLNATAAQSY